MNAAAKVWAALWPNGIPPEKYEDALMLVEIAKHATAETPPPVRAKEKSAYVAHEVDDKMVTRSEAARVTGFSQVAIGRWLVAEEVPGASKVDGMWAMPLAAVVERASRAKKMPKRGPRK